MSPLSPNMARDDMAPLPNHDEDDNVDSGFCSGFLRTTSLYDCHREYEILQKNQIELSDCDFYYPDLNSSSARNFLKHNSVGSFLVRNSSDSKYLFSLSVKTEQGTTSIRILYLKGYFLFDCDERIQHRMPRFDSVISLIDHHVHLTTVGANKSWRWEDNSGKKKVPVKLNKPVRKSVSSLVRLCTIKINQCIQDAPNPLIHQLPVVIQDSIWKYPYCV